MPIAFGSIYGVELSDEWALAIRRGTPTGRSLFPRVKGDDGPWARILNPDILPFRIVGFAQLRIVIDALRGIGYPHWAQRVYYAGVASRAESDKAPDATDGLRPSFDIELPLSAFGIGPYDTLDKMELARAVEPLGLSLNPFIEPHPFLEEWDHGVSMLLPWSRLVGKGGTPSALWRIGILPSEIFEWTEGKLLDAAKNPTTSRAGFQWPLKPDDEEVVPWLAQLLPQRSAATPALSLAKRGLSGGAVLNTGMMQGDSVPVGSNKTMPQPTPKTPKQQRPMLDQLRARVKTLAQRTGSTASTLSGPRPLTMLEVLKTSLDGGGEQIIDVGTLFVDQADNTAPWKLPLYAGELCVLIGDTGLGKSAVFENMLVAAKDIGPVLHLATENGQLEELRRFFQIAHGFRVVTQEGIDEVAEMLSSGGHLDPAIVEPIEHIHIYDTPCTVEEIGAMASSIGARLVVVDTLEQLKGSDPHAEEYSRQVDCMKELMAMARMHRLVVLVVHHVNKSGMDVARVQLNHAKGAKTAVELAQVVLGFNGIRFQRDRFVELLKGRGRTLPTCYYRNQSAPGFHLRGDAATYRFRLVGEAPDPTPSTPPAAGPLSTGSPSVDLSTLTPDL